MAYFTEITAARELTESEATQLTSYVSAQATAGTTSGQLYVWPVSNSETVQTVRMWSNSESATGYQTLLAGFSPAVPVAIY
jgi:hypothetical protein